MFALKTGNAVIFAPHPKAERCTAHLTDAFMEVVKANGGPDDLVQMVSNGSVETTQELMKDVDVVVATGGGTFVDPDNRAAMLADGCVVWLDVPLPQIMERVPADGRRPLAADRVQMEQLYVRRRLAYAEAHVRIDATRPVPEVVEHLLEWIGY